MEVRELVRELRKKKTAAEQAFWEIIRNRQINNLKFYRQKPIFFKYDEQKRMFIADFYCPECKLIIELDGKIHEKQKEYDKLRDYIINNLGLNIIRIKNEEVYQEEMQSKLEKLITKYIK